MRVAYTRLVLLCFCSYLILLGVAMGGKVSKEQEELLQVLRADKQPKEPISEAQAKAFLASLKEVDAVPDWIMSAKFFMYLKDQKPSKEVKQQLTLLSDRITEGTFAHKFGKDAKFVRGRDLYGILVSKIDQLLKKIDAIESQNTK